MKIAIISHSHYPIRQPFMGGMEAHTFHLTRALVKNGHDVTLYAAAGSDRSLPVKTFCNPTAAEIFGRNNGHVVRYREQCYTALCEKLAADRSLDIIHNNSLHYVPLHYAARMSMPMVTALHTPPFIPMMSGMAQAVAAHRHSTIAVSTICARLWREAVPGIAPHVIYNGIDGSRWRPAAQKNGKAIWFGRITSEKGTHLAIKAAVKAGIPLSLYGPVHDDRYFKQHIRPLLQAHSQQVRYRGTADSLRLSRAVARASVALFTPCWEEPFGYTAVEALACGTPVAGFARGALTEILSNETAVLVSEGVTPLANAMQRALRLSPLTCRQHALKHFTLDGMIERYEAHYSSALAASNTVPQRRAV